MPTPRIAFTQALQPIDRITLNDVSDGIANELTEIATDSQVTIHIDDDKVPIHPSLHQFTKEEQTEWKYRGGEDFEIVGTVHATKYKEIEKIAKKRNVQLTKIGTVSYNEQRKGQVFVRRDNTVQPLLTGGFQHLK